MKLPYFPFYVDDWTSSTTISKLKPELEGAYIRLLAHCWANNGLPDNDEEIMLLGRIGNAQGLAKIKELFTEKVDGKLWNKRLVSERRKIIDAQESRIKGGKNRWSKAKAIGKAQKRGHNSLAEGEVSLDSRESPSPKDSLPSAKPLTFAEREWLAEIKRYPHLAKYKNAKEMMQDVKRKNDEKIARFEKEKAERTVALERELKQGS